MTPHALTTKLIALTILLLIHNAAALEILAIVSLPLHSHYMAFRNLFRELAIRGHNVTVLNNFPDKDPPSNLRFVDLQVKPLLSVQRLEEYEACDSTYMHLTNYYRHISLGYANTKSDCEYLFESENVKAHFTEARKYDVIFVEQFMSDCGLAYAMTMYDSPIIGIASHTLLPFAYPRLGLPFDVAADAFYFSNSGPNPSLFQKVENYLGNLIFTTVGWWAVQRGIYEVFDKYVPNHSLDVERDVRSRMKMMFSYQHFTVTGARVIAPQVLEIGGIHIGVPKPVPKDVADFLTDAKHGAIYVSFGSNLKASTMSERKLQEFLTAFKRLPYKIIWKYENANFTQENLYTGTWLPQLDILCHPKILAFVSHGGMLSLSESTHCGKPLITVPFFGDQFSNAAAVKAVGLGKTLFFDRLTADSLETAIRELCSDEMLRNAKRISQLWHDRPMPVMDSAIYWTEYVARYKIAPPSLPAKHNTWFESLLIDVFIVILGILFLIGLIFYLFSKLLKFILEAFLRKCYRNKLKGE